MTHRFKDFARWHLASSSILSAVCATWDLRSRWKCLISLRRLESQYFSSLQTPKHWRDYCRGSLRTESSCCRTHACHYVREYLWIPNICLRKKQGSHTRRSRLVNPNFHEPNHEVIPAGIGAIDALETTHVFCYAAILERLLIERACQGLSTCWYNILGLLRNGHSFRSRLQLALPNSENLLPLQHCTKCVLIYSPAIDNL